MMFAVPSERYQIDPDFVVALNALLVLHADHGQNCSTSTVRMVGSSTVNLFSSISAGIYALWGALHGGANEACINMLEQIKEDGGNLGKYVDRAKDPDDPFRLMGFGHRVYKNYDPRAAIIKRYADEILSKSPNGDRELLDIAQELEATALRDDYFKERKLYPNVDFYTGLIYEAMGFPVEMFTVLFALGRLPGWIAQYREHAANPKAKISRPRQIYIGEDKRDYVPLENR
jgi:citrate synthase